jgi:hypothetical protein
MGRDDCAGTGVRLRAASAFHFGDGGTNFWKIRLATVDALFCEASFGCDTQAHAVGFPIRNSKEFLAVQSLRLLKRRDQRTFHPPTCSAATLDEPLKRPLDPLQVGKPGSHVRQFVLGLLAGLGAVGAILELEQDRDLIQAEAQSLGGLDEAHARQIRVTVATDATQGTLRLLHQALALVEADRLDIDTGGIG